MLPFLLYWYLKQTMFDYYLGNIFDLTFLWYYVSNDNLTRDMFCTGILLMVCDDNNYVLPYIKNFINNCI